MVRPLKESTWPAYAALVEANGGIFGGCWCMGMHPDGLDRTSAEVNRDNKLRLVREGAAHAALVFQGEDCLGWVQFGPPSEVARIKNRSAAEKDRALPDWRIGCCYVGKGHRRRGVTAAALAGALDLIRDLGGGTVEGYPEPAGDVAAGFLYHGALSTYEKLGFTRVRQIGKHRWVVSKRVRGRRSPAQATWSERFERPIQKPSMTCSPGSSGSVAAPRVTNNGV